MRGCHNCETAVEIANGKYQGKKWDELPCATCEVVAETSHAMEYDENRPAANPVNRLQTTDLGGAGAEEMMPVSVLSDAMAELLTMPRELRDLICWRNSGMLYREIGLVLRVSPAAVERRLKRAMKKWPALAAMFAVKAAKQKRRKLHRRHR